MHVLCNGIIMNRVWVSIVYVGNDGHTSCYGRSGMPYTTSYMKQGLSSFFLQDDVGIVIQ